MHRSLILIKSTASSTRWLVRQTADPYVRLRSQSPKGRAGPPPAYRSRSAFKLLSLAERHPILLSPPKEFDHDKIVVDLGAAPGGWSQVASHLLGERGRVFAVDLLDVAPINGVEVLKGDFHGASVQGDLQARIKAYRPKTFGLESESGYEDRQNAGVDTVLSDMMSPMSGIRLRDVQASLDLVIAATTFAKSVLRKAGEDEVYKEERGRKVYPGGNLVLKYFMHPDLDEFRRDELEGKFWKVVTEKPKESRADVGVKAPGRAVIVVPAALVASAKEDAEANSGVPAPLTAEAKATAVDERDTFERTPDNWASPWLGVDVPSPRAVETEASDERGKSAVTAVVIEEVGTVLPALGEDVPTFDADGEGLGGGTTGAEEGGVGGAGRAEGVIELDVGLGGDGDEETTLAAPFLGSKGERRKNVKYPLPPHDCSASPAQGDEHELSVVVAKPVTALAQ